MAVWLSEHLHTQLLSFLYMSCWDVQLEWPVHPYQKRQDLSVAPKDSGGRCRAPSLILRKERLIRPHELDACGDPCRCSAAKALSSLLDHLNSRKNHHLSFLSIGLVLSQALDKAHQLPQDIFCADIRQETN